MYNTKHYKLRLKTEDQIELFDFYTQQPCYQNKLSHGFSFYCLHDLPLYLHIKL